MRHVRRTDIFHSTDSVLSAVDYTLSDTDDRISTRENQNMPIKVTQYLDLGNTRNKKYA